MASLLLNLEAMHPLRWLLATMALAALSCASSRLIALRPQRPIAEEELATRPLHVISSIDHAADPLPLQGDGLVFAGVASTLGSTIAAASSTWAGHHQSERPGGWELRVDLIQSHAELSQGRVTVELATRVTLSAAVGQVYLAQTHGYCRQTDVLASDPTGTVYTCMESMAHDLAGWLEGVQP